MKLKLSNSIEKAYLFWIDIELGIPPLCGGTFGEWHIDNNVIELHDDFKKSICDIVLIICHKDKTDSNNPISILLDFKDDYDFDIEDIKSYDNLINCLYDLNKTKTYNELKKYADYVFLLLNNIGLKCNFYLYDSIDKALELVKQHNNITITNDYDYVFENDRMEG